MRADFVSRFCEQVFCLANETCVCDYLLCIKYLAPQTKKLEKDAIALQYLAGVWTSINSLNKGVLTDVFWGKICSLILNQSYFKKKNMGVVPSTMGF